ncbi:MAG: hypothetical protein WC787_04360 [Patescibacteria group bacterium]|jgi:hypothetical protein
MSSPALAVNLLRTQDLIGIKELLFTVDGTAQDYDAFLRPIDVTCPDPVALVVRVKMFNALRKTGFHLEPHGETSSQARVWILSQQEAKQQMDAWTRALEALPADL